MFAFKYKLFEINIIYLRLTKIKLFIYDSYYNNNYLEKIYILECKLIDRLVCNFNFHRAIISR